MIREKEAGFTLLEILVAVTILAVTFSALSRLYGGALRNVANGELRARAAMLCEVKMDEALAATPLLPKTDTGTFAQNPEYTYRYSVVPYEKPIGRADRAVLRDATERVAAYEVSVEVGWKEDGAGKRISMHTLKTVVEENR